MSIRKRLTAFASAAALFITMLPASVSAHDGEHKIYKGFGATWALSFRKREGEYTSREGTIERYHPVWLLDGSVYWRNEWIKVSVDAKNMANQLYYDFSGVVQPRHWVSATIQVKINKNE